MANVVDSILHEYPYPIAKCYERLVGVRDATERWNSTRYLLEATLKYCACVSVARYLHNKEFDEKTNAALACLNRPSLGHWLNLLIRCEKNNRNLQKAFIRESSFMASGQRPAMLEAHSAMLAERDQKYSGTAKTLTLTKFLETYIAYRNRTSGHGAPSAEHIEKMAPILENAAIELIVNLEEIQKIQLIYVSDIRLERSSYVHSMVRLMGTTQVSMPDYVSGLENALVGHDKKLFLCFEGESKLFVTLHPLGIYTSGEVFLLHHSDLKGSVDYICHHSGEFYSADRIYEDFRETLGSFLNSSGENEGKYEPNDLYRESVRVSFLDGVLTSQEQEYLAELRSQLAISEDVAEAIELEVRKEMPESQVFISQGGTTRADSNSLPAQETYSDKSHLTRVLFFSYASVEDSFWGSLVARLSAAIYQRDYVFSMVTTDPANHHDVAAMSNLAADLDRIIQLHNPDLIAMVPFPTEAFSKLFQKRFSGYSIPLVTIDTEFSENVGFTGMPGGRPSAILIDNKLGGALAAKILLEQHIESKIPPRYLVMPGIEDALHSKDRVQGFTDGILAARPDARVKILPEGRFDRSRSRQIFTDFLDDVDISRYQGIFCCNDGMALGVYEAIAQEIKNGSAKPSFWIVGFNNSIEFQSIMAVDPYDLLLVSVDQSLEDYATAIVSAIDILLAGGEIADRTLINPRLTKRE